MTQCGSLAINAIATTMVSTVSKKLSTSHKPQFIHEWLGKVVELVSSGSSWICVVGLIRTRRSENYFVGLTKEPRQAHSISAPW